jgi:hypothetical protein
MPHVYDMFSCVAGAMAATSSTTEIVLEVSNLQPVFYYFQVELLFINTYCAATLHENCQSAVMCRLDHLLIFCEIHDGSFLLVQSKVGTLVDSVPEVETRLASNALRLIECRKPPLYL